MSEPGNNQVQIRKFNSGNAGMTKGKDVPPGGILLHPVGGDNLVARTRVELVTSGL